jgi:dolichyl-phosphate-mannose-protein mannosyltransferase
MRNDGPLSTRHTWWLFAITFLVYFSTASGVLEFGDDWSMLQVTSSVVNHGRIDVPAGTPASVLGSQGRFYSKCGLGLSLLAMPFFVAGTRIASWTGNAAADGDRFKQATALTYILTILGMLATALSVAFFFLCLRVMGFGARASSVAALALGLGTFAWYWALTFMTEPPTMLALLIAFYGHLRDGDRPSPAWLMIAGTALACALLLRVASVIVLPGFGLWLLWEVRRSSGRVRTAAWRLVAWISPVAIGLVGVATYNFFRFGSFVDVGYGAPSTNLHGTTWVGLYGFLLSPGRSMFLYAPILLASAAGWSSLWRIRRHIAVAIGAVVLPYVVFHSRLTYWDGGGCWSPRYISTILPFLMVGLAALVDRGLSRTAWVVLACVGIVSVGVQSLAVSVSCIPYASRMLATDASADRMMWHPAYSPLVDHIRSVLVHERPPHLAPVFFHSNALAWLQASALVAGVALLLAYIRRVFWVLPSAYDHV